MRCATQKAHALHSARNTFRSRIDQTGNEYLICIYALQNVVYKRPFKLEPFFRKGLDVAFATTLDP